MDFEDKGIVISIKRHGETSGILEILTEKHGRYLGLVRNFNSKINRGVLQSGNTLHIRWKARLSEHLGVFYFELLSSKSQVLINNKIALLVLQNIIRHLKLLPERQEHIEIFHATQNLLDKADEKVKLIEMYIKWELFFLRELGYGIDVSECAVTKTKDDLKYVSPKSRKAVTSKIGDPYKNKLLPLPSFLINDETATILDLKKGLLLTGFFLKRDIYNPIELKLSHFRDKLVDVTNSL